MSCDPAYTFSIDDHSMTIIEADSVNTKPLEVDSIQIFAGQRYSFVLEATQDVGNYWVRAHPLFGTTGFDGGINSAILRYDTASPTEPTTTQAVSTKPLKETDLEPLASMPVVSLISLGCRLRTDAGSVARHCRLGRCGQGYQLRFQLRTCH